MRVFIWIFCMYVLIFSSLLDLTQWQYIIYCPFTSMTDSISLVSAFLLNMLPAFPPEQVHPLHLKSNIYIVCQNSILELFLLFKVQTLGFLANLVPSLPTLSHLPKSIAVTDVSSISDGWVIHCWHPKPFKSILYSEPTQLTGMENLSLELRTHAC